jgi:Holliday junction resolvase-like predicted endonuclease
MILAQNICKSTKHVGKYEEKIIQTLAAYFQLEGYEVVPHSSLNIAWGSVISDVDLLLIKNQLLTFVEVKSSKDKIARAKKQIDRVKDYVDYAYVATEKNVEDWALVKVGLIRVRDRTVTLLKNPSKFSKKPRFYSVATLKKKCLARLFGIDNRHILSVSKYELAKHVYTKRKCTRSILREIVTCGELCATNCPIVKEEN